MEWYGTFFSRNRSIRELYVRNRGRNSSNIGAFLFLFEKNINELKPDLAFIYANQYNFDNEDNFSNYDDVQEIIKNHVVLLYMHLNISV